jgi:hypothetical protein
MGLNTLKYIATEEVKKEKKENYLKEDKQWIIIYIELTFK